MGYGANFISLKIEPKQPVDGVNCMFSAKLPIHIQRTLFLVMRVRRNQYNLFMHAITFQLEKGVCSEWTK
jgi:hypothetical protein